MIRFELSQLRWNCAPPAPHDLELLRHWDEQPHIVASDPNDDWAWEIELNRSPDWREQLIAEVDGYPIGFIQIIVSERVNERRRFGEDECIVYRLASNFYRRGCSRPH